jgi:hypothetical protein
MRLHVLVVPLVLLVVGLAGCIGGGSPESDEEADKGVCLAEDPLCDGGGVEVLGEEKGGAVIQGFVTDEAFAPIVNARVVVEELDLSLTTDDTGQFSFTGVPAGTYGIRAERIGYNPAKKSVTVGESGTANVEFTLKAIRKEVAYHKTQHFAGFWECNTHEVNCGKPLDDTGLSEQLGRQANDAYQWTLPLDRKLAGLVVEVVWTPGASPASDRFEVTIRNDVSQDETPLKEGKGASPLLVRVEQSEIETASLAEGGSVTIRVDLAPTQGQEPSDGVGFGFAFEQPFDVYVTPFYLDPAPDGFSPAADCADTGC